MMRIVTQRLGSITRVIHNRAALAQPVAAQTNRLMSSAVVETDEEFDSRYVAYFNRPDIDGWEIRKALNALNNMDLIPEPKIIIAALHACRRVNDYAITTRMLEFIKFKADGCNSAIYPYIMKEIKPTMDELGVSSIEEMGYDKPELALQRSEDMEPPV